MTERTNMLLRLLIFLTIAGIVGIALYWLFFRSTPEVAPEVTPTVQEEGTGGLPTSGEAGERPDIAQGEGSLPISPTAQGGITDILTLTTAPVVRPTGRVQGGVAYYDPADGRFYSIRNNGSPEALSDTRFPNAQNITFAPSGSAVAVEFPDGSNVLYDFTAQRQTTIPSHWEDFSFTGDGAAVAAKSIGNDPSNRSLVVTATDGSSTQVIAALGNNQDKVDVNISGDGGVVAFSRTGGEGSTFGQRDIYLIAPDGEASGVLVVNGTNFHALWSPNSAHLLYSVADAGDDYRASLWYADRLGDRAGEPRRRLSVKTTVDKCVFADDTTVYCAVPRTMPAGGGAGGSLLRGPDQLYRINVTTGTATLAAIPVFATAMRNLAIDESGSSIYFLDDQGRLSVVRLR